MLTISRSASYRIITRALQLEGEALVALLAPAAADCEPCATAEQLSDGLQAQPDSIIVYNQQDAARALIAQLDLPASQVFIEIRQDTRGVLGLHAQRRGAGGVETLELIYQ